MKIVYISAVPWLSISQRPHFFAKYALANAATELLWIEPYASRFPNLSDFIPGRHAAEPSGLDLIEGLKVFNIGFVAPVEPIQPLFNILNKKKIDRLFDEVDKYICQNTILIIGKPCLLAKMLARKFKWRSIWYDAMDDFPSFYGGFSKLNAIRNERSIASLSQKIFCSSHELENKFNKLTSNKTTLVLNACSDDITASSNINKVNNKITFGYIGTIAVWFDWSWVIKLATKNPDANVKLIGPLKVRTPKNLPSNIFIEPAIPHHLVMKEIAQFDYVIIPFLQSEITKYVDPVKFYEYRLAGKTILSTAFGEMLWHYESELEDNPSESYTIDINLPQETLVFRPLGKESRIPRWSDRFSLIF